MLNKINFFAILSFSLIFYSCTQKPIQGSSDPFRKPSSGSGAGIIHCQSQDGKYNFKSGTTTYEYEEQGRAFYSGDDAQMFIKDGHADKAKTIDFVTSVASSFKQRHFFMLSHNLEVVDPKDPNFAFDQEGFDYLKKVTNGKSYFLARYYISGIGPRKIIHRAVRNMNDYYSTEELDFSQKLRVYKIADSYNGKTLETERNKESFQDINFTCHLREQMGKTDTEF